MKLTFNFRGGSEQARKQAEANIGALARERLEPLLQGRKIHWDGTLQVLLEHDERKGRWQVKMHLHVPPKKILVATAGGDEVTAVAGKALQRLQRELRRHIDRVGHQEQYKRKARRKRLREQKARYGALPVELAQQAERATGALLPRLERVIRRELAYLRSQGELPADYPTVQEVLDDVVMAVKGDWRQTEDADRLYIELLRALYRILDREVAVSRVYGRSLSLEEAPPADAEDQAEAMVGEEQMEFWQPDESLRMEDVLADESVEGPEEMLEEAEEIAYVMELVRQLPTLWRRILLLHRLDGIGRVELALLFGMPEAEVEKIIDVAAMYLSACLDGAGIGSGGGRRLLGLE